MGEGGKRELQELTKEREGKESEREWTGKKPHDTTLIHFRRMV